MSMWMKAPFLRMMAAALCAAGACLANTGISPRPGGPHCRSATSLETSTAHSCQHGINPLLIAVGVARRRQGGLEGLRNDRPALTQIFRE